MTCREKEENEHLLFAIHKFEHSTFFSFILCDHGRGDGEDLSMEIPFHRYNIGVLLQWQRVWKLASNNHTVCRYVLCWFPYESQKISSHKKTEQFCSDFLFANIHQNIMIICHLLPPLDLLVFCLPSGCWIGWHNRTYKQL